MSAQQFLFCAFIFVPFWAGPGLSQMIPVGCPPCVDVDPLPGQEADALAGLYKFKEIEEECPGGCSYYRTDDPDSVYCIGEGIRTGQHKCPLTYPTEGTSKVSGSQPITKEGTTSSVSLQTKITEAALEGSTQTTSESLTTGILQAITSESTDRVSEFSGSQSITKEGTTISGTLEVSGSQPITKEGTTSSVSSQSKITEAALEGSTQTISESLTTGILQAIISESTDRVSEYSGSQSITKEGTTISGTLEVSGSQPTTTEGTTSSLSESTDRTSGGTIKGSSPIGTLSSTEVDTLAQTGTAMEKSSINPSTAPEYSLPLKLTVASTSTLFISLSSSSITAVKKGSTVTALTGSSKVTATVTTVSGSSTVLATKGSSTVIDVMVSSATTAKGSTQGVTTTGRLFTTVAATTAKTTTMTTTTTTTLTTRSTKSTATIMSTTTIITTTTATKTTKTTTATTTKTTTTTTTTTRTTTTTTTTTTTPKCPTGVGSIAESCEPGWSQIQKKCYKLEKPTIAVNWDDADVECKSKAALLASIESQCEQDFLFTLSEKAAVWIGGNDKTTEGTFVWPNGVEFYKSSSPVAGVFENVFTNGFDKLSTDTQDCVSLKEETGEWDDILCTKTENYICEKAAYTGADTFTPPPKLPVTTVACSGTCASGWTALGCQCYKFEDTVKTWQSATDACKTLGDAEGKTARLVSITSNAVEVQLMSVGGALIEENGFWTGGNDKATQKTFVWDLDSTEFWKDDVETGYNNWWISTAATQPNHIENQDCVKFRLKYKTSGDQLSGIDKTGWDDVNCDQELDYVCQYSIA